MKIILIIACILLPLYTSCGNKTVFGEDARLSTAPLTVSQSILPENLDREVRVKGTVKAICPDDGCWIAVSDVANTLRIEFKDGKIVPPYTLGQVPIVLEGRMVMKVISPDSKGFSDYEKSCGVENLTSSTRVPVMVAYRMEILSE